MIRSGVARVLACSLVLSVAAPAFAAPAATQVITGADAQLVTRGDFIRAAIQVLDITLEKGQRAVPFPDKIPASLQPYIQTADTHHALGAFGSALDLSKGIKKGEALRVLLQLSDLTPKAKPAQTFVDVAKGSEDETAVALALERDWMRPLTPRFFGLSRLMHAKDARLLLSRAAKPDAAQTIKVPIVRIQGQGQTTREVPKADVLQGVWNLLYDEYLYKDRIDGNKAADSAIQGLVQSLHDPYTTYLPKSDYQNFQNQLKGEVEGIGAQVEQTGGILFIVAPLPGSPAEKAGLQAKDQVLKADGVDLTGKGFDEAVGKIRGPKGSSVVLHIRRAGVEFDVSVVRDLVKIADITVTTQDNVAIVKISQFGNGTDTDIRAKMAEVAKTHPRGIVVDLRNNPGGLLHAAGQVASAFLPKGSPYVIIASRADTQTEYTDQDPVVDASVPVVLLVNKGSASASEVVTGALQDAKRVKVVGEKTFGKGTVQQIEQFSDGSSLKLTIAEWHTPLGRKIDGVGIDPDETVVFQAGDRDAQLLRALDILRY